MAGKPHDALGTIGQIRNRGDVRARDLTLEGTAYAAIGREDDARRAFASGDRCRSARRHRLRETWRHSIWTPGTIRAAAALFAEALILDPASRVAREGLAAALRRQR
jgi:hypothetical protein